MIRKPLVVTFRLDQATWDRMRDVVPYTRYRNNSSFIREGIDLLAVVQMTTIPLLL